MIGGVDRDVRGTAQLPLNTWTHLATTYDGSALRLYVNGTQVATLAATGSIVTSTGALKIGGNALWGEWYSGLIDELRVYNRALTPTEIQGDMTRPVTSADTTAPSAPGTLRCGWGRWDGRRCRWAASTDNVGVVRYNVHRGTSAGFTPSVANRIAQPTTARATSIPRRRAATSTRSLPRTRPATSAPVSNEARGDGVGRHDGARARRRRLPARSSAAPSTSAGLRPPTTSASPATTSTAAPPPASRPAPRTGSRSRPGPATPTPAWRPAATSTRSPPRTRPATSAPPRTRQPRPSPTPPRRQRPARSPPPSPAAPSTSAGRSHRQRRRQPLQPPPRHHQRLHPQPRQPDRATHRAQLRRHRRRPGSYFYKLTAEDAAGNISPVSNTASATVPDTTPPSTPTTSPPPAAPARPASPGPPPPTTSPSRRYNLHRSTTAGFTPTAGNRIAQPTATSYTDTGLAAGTYYYKLTAEDAAANISPASNEATATVSTPPVTGLVAAYGFDTGSGTSAPDQSGTGNNGTLTNATWTGAQANTATHSPSTAPTPPSPSPTSLASTSPPA